MSHVEHVQKLMEDLGPANALIGEVLRNGEFEWAVAFEEDLDNFILIELDDANGRLYLSCELGAPAEERRVEVYETLLTYNSMLRETGGVVAALTGPKGVLSQRLELDATDLSLELLQTVLTNFAEKAAVWRAYVTAESGSPAGESEPSSLGMRV